MCAGIPDSRAARARACAWLPVDKCQSNVFDEKWKPNPKQRITESIMKHKLTTTMRNNPPREPPTSNPPRISLEPLDGVERPAHLERPDPLEVLALEPQPDDGPRRRTCLFLPLAVRLLSVAHGRSLPVPGPVPRRRRRKPRQRRVGQHGRAVDVRPHEVVRRDHRGARQGRAGAWVCHRVCPAFGGWWWCLWRALCCVVVPRCPCESV
jgi:hypothetical protein